MFYSLTNMGNLISSQYPDVQPESVYNCSFLIVLQFEAFNSNQRLNVSRIMEEEHLYASAENDNHNDVYVYDAYADNNGDDNEPTTLPGHIQRAFDDPGHIQRALLNSDVLNVCALVTTTVCNTGVHYGKHTLNFT